MEECRHFLYNVILVINNALCNFMRIIESQIFVLKTLKGLKIPGNTVIIARMILTIQVEISTYKT